MKIPFSVILDGRSYFGAGLSLVAALATGLSAPHLEGQRRLVTLQFNFEGYTVNLAVQAKVESVSSESGLLTLRFTEPSGPHLPQLRYLLNSFVAGELVDLDGLLTSTGGYARENKAPGARRVSARMRIRQFANTAAITVASIALAFVVARGIYNRFFVMEAPGLSVVAVDGFSLQATSSGQLDYINLNAKVGEPVFAIRSNSGDLLTVNMPCSCRVLPGQLVAGSTVLAGNPVVDIIQGDAQPVVKTAISSKALRALAAGSQARIGLPDGSEVQATFKGGLVFSPVQRADGLIDTTLVPEAPISADAVGSPVTVRIVSQPFQALTSSSVFETVKGWL